MLFLRIGIRCVAGMGAAERMGVGAVASLDVVKTSTLAAGSRGALVGEGVAEVIP